MQNSLISWTHHTFNPWIGCAKVHAGCKHCYAEELMDTRYGRVEWGPNGTRSRTKTWGEPRKWNRKAEQLSERHRVFCCSLADVFEDRTELRPWRKQLFQLIDETPHLDWLLLTKRPENIRRMWTKPAAYNSDLKGFCRNNVWLGTSVSNQETATPALTLLQCRELAPVLFLSCEPLIGPIDLHRVETPTGKLYSVLTGFVADGESRQTGSFTDDLGFRRPTIDWVIVGGESGKQARECKTEWLVDIKRQCFGQVAFFMKQLGAKTDVPISDRKGETKEDWPAELQHQQFPALTPA